MLRKVKRKLVRIYKERGFRFNKSYSRCPVLYLLLTDKLREGTEVKRARNDLLNELKGKSHIFSFLFLIKSIVFFIWFF